MNAPQPSGSTISFHSAAAHESRASQGGSGRTEIFSYLFFASLIATTFLF